MQLLQEMKSRASHMMNKREKYEACINSKLKTWGVTYERIEDDNILKYVYDLYEKNKYTDCDNDLYLNCAGMYALCHDNYNLSEKYFLEAINKGNIQSIFNIAILYNRQKRYDLVEEYYLMSIDKGHTLSIRELARLYHYLQKFNLAEKYYLMAIDKGSSISMHNLAIIYAIQEKYELSAHYYVMSALNNHKQSIDKVNMMLTESFHLDYSIKLSSVLHGRNKSILNEVLKFVENHKSESFFL